MSLASTLLATGLQDTDTRLAADTINLSPVMDNTLYEDPEGDASNGAGTAMFAGRNSASTYSIRRGLLAFDVAAAIPAGSTIDAVTLTLFNDAANTSPQMVSLHRLDQSWGEGATVAGGGQGSGAPAAAGDATWTHRFYGTDLWTVPGGDFAPMASNSAIVSGAGYYSWPSNASFVADVQDFLDNPSGNFGWLLLGGEAEINTAKRFATREAVDPSLRPALTIEFTPVPEPSSGLLLLILALARPRRPQLFLFRSSKSCHPNSPTSVRPLPFAY